MAEVAHKLAIFRGILKFKSNVQKHSANEIECRCAFTSTLSPVLIDILPHANIDGFRT